MMLRKLLIFSLVTLGITTRSEAEWVSRGRLVPTNPIAVFNPACQYRVKWNATYHQEGMADRYAESVFEMTYAHNYLGETGKIGDSFIEGRITIPQIVSLGYTNEFAAGVYFPAGTRTPITAKALHDFFANTPTALEPRIQVRLWDGYTVKPRVALDFTELKDYGTGPLWTTSSFAIKGDNFSLEENCPSQKITNIAVTSSVNSSTAGNLVDSNNGTFWTLQPGAAATITLDLKSTYTLTSLFMDFYSQNFASTDYKVESSADGVNFITLRSSLKGDYDVPLGSIKARILRITLGKNPIYPPVLREIVVNGVKA